jgi:anti-sigma B factor antagonist
LLNDSRPTPFTCDVAGTDGLVSLRLGGELDIATVRVVEQRLREALDGGGRRLVVDLRGLEFMDSTGLTLLMRWAIGSQRDGYELALVRGEDRIQRLFELTGLSAHFTFVDE